MIYRLFINIVGIFSKLAAAVILSFAYFSIFSIINVDNNAFTVAGILFISYIVADTFIRISSKVYESSLLEDFEELVETVVLEKAEKKAFINKNLRQKYTIQFELNVLLLIFAFIIMFLATVFSNYYENGWEVGIFYSREILSSIFLSTSMVVTLFLLIKIIVKFRTKKGLSFIKALSLNAFVLYIALVFYVFSFIDSIFVLFG